MSDSEQIEVKVIEIPLNEEEIILDKLILNYPFNFRSSYLWYRLKAMGLVGCNCCCCCCGCGAGCTAAGGAVGGGVIVNPAAAPAATPAPAPVTNLQVTLTAMGYSLVVGGSYTARVELEWNATGGGNPSVDIQVRSQLIVGTYRNWTTIYANRPASGREAWPAAAAPGEHLQFRAVASDSNGNTATSNVVTV